MLSDGPTRMESASLATRVWSIIFSTFGRWNKFTSATDARLPSRIVHQLISCRFLRFIKSIIAVENLSIVIRILAITSSSPVVASTATIIILTIISISISVVVVVSHGGKLFKLSLFLLVLVLIVVVLASHVFLLLRFEHSQASLKAANSILAALLVILLTIFGVIVSWWSPIWLPLHIVSIEVSRDLIHLCRV